MLGVYNKISLCRKETFISCSCRQACTEYKIFAYNHIYSVHYTIWHHCFKRRLEQGSPMYKQEAAVKIENVPNNLSVSEQANRGRLA